MSIKGIIVISLILCLLGSSLEKSYGEEFEGEELSSKYHIVEVSSLLPSTICNRSKNVPIKGSIELVHKDGPCSELNQNKIKLPSWSQILRKDRARAQFINAKRHYMSSNRTGFKQSEFVTFPFDYNFSIAGGEIYAKIKFGTPGQTSYVILDTGSDITWIQCKPCTRCFKQPIPTFDPSHSSTYRTIDCKSPKCRVNSDQDPCVSNRCRYHVSYGDGSYSYGDFVEDRLTYSTSDGRELVIDNYLFGCGFNNHDINQAGSIGLMGLDRASSSFVYQSGQLFNKYFSYCIPSDYSSIGYMTFGPSNDINNKFIKFTPIPTTPEQSEYYDVTVTGISIAGKMLRINKSAFKNTIIDSGTTTSIINSKAFSVFNNAFRNAMAQYKRVPGDSITDTCYDFSGYKSVVIPRIKFFFKGGVEYEVNVKGIMYTSDVKSVCLAFTSGQEDVVPILGNLWQRSVQIVHDVDGRRVGFGPGVCA